MTKTAILVSPIRTKEDYRVARDRIEKLMSAEPNTPEGDELDVLATLVDAYEEEHFPMDAPDPITAIEFLMEQRGLTRKDLEPMIGSRARLRGDEPQARTHALRWCAACAPASASPRTC